MESATEHYAVHRYENHAAASYNTNRGAEANQPHQAEKDAAASPAEQQQHSLNDDKAQTYAQQHQPQACLGVDEVPATAEQMAAAAEGQLKVLDVQHVAERFLSELSPDPLSYVHHLAALAPVSKLAKPDMGSKLPPNVQPSTLQRKLCCKANKLSSTLLPTPTADGLSFHDMPAIRDGNGSGSQVQSQPHQLQQAPCVAGTSASSSSSSKHVLQFNFGLLKATHVGPTGFQHQREPMYHAARIAIFDKAKGRFLGNIHTVAPIEVKAKGSTWVWGPEGASRTLAGCDKPRPDPIPPGQLAGSPAVAAAAVASAGVLGSFTEGLADHVSLGGGFAGAGGANTFIVRCAKEGLDPVSGLRLIDEERLSLYIELNVAFRLTALDAGVVPQADTKGVGVVSELTTCWALVSLKRCAELTREMDISVPLYAGSIYQPGLLAAVWAAERKLHPLRSMFSAAPAPQLSFRVGPLQATPPPLLPYSLMPTTFIARRNVAYCLAAAKLAISHQLTAAAAGSMAGAVHGFSDAALAALPALLDDVLLLEELICRWWGRCKGLVAAMEQQVQADCLLSSCSCVTSSTPPTHAQLIAALKASILEVSPLLHCSNMPPDHMTNFAEHQQHRAQVAAKFLRHLDPKSGRQMSAAAGGGARHPVEVLSGVGGEFLHQPFDVSETRVCLGDQLQAHKWSSC